MQDSIKKSLLAIVVIASIAGIVTFSMFPKPKQKVTKKVKVDVQMEEVDNDVSSKPVDGKSVESNEVAGNGAQEQRESENRGNIVNNQEINPAFDIELKENEDSGNLDQLTKLGTLEQSIEIEPSLKFGFESDAPASEIEPQMIIDDSASTPALPAITPVQELLNVVTDTTTPLDSGVVIGSESLIDAINHVTIPHVNGLVNDEGKDEDKEPIDEPPVVDEELPSATSDEINITEKAVDDNPVSSDQTIEPVFNDEPVVENSGPVQQTDDTVEILEEKLDDVPVSDVEPVVLTDDASTPVLQMDSDQHEVENSPAVNGYIPEEGEAIDNDVPVENAVADNEQVEEQQDNIQAVDENLEVDHESEVVASEDHIKDIAPIQELLKAVVNGTDDVQDLVKAVNQIGTSNESNQTKNEICIDEVYETATDGIFDATSIYFVDFEGEYHCLQVFKGYNEPLDRYIFSLWYSNDVSGRTSIVSEQDIDSNGDGASSKDASTTNSNTNLSNNPETQTQSQSQSKKKSKKSKKKKGGNADGVGEESDDTTLQDMTDDEIDIAKPVFNIQATEFVPSAYPIYTEFYPTFEDSGYNSRKPKKSKRKFVKKTHTHDPTLADFVKVPRVRTKSSSRCMFGMTCANKDCVYAHE